MSEKVNEWRIAFKVLILMGGIAVLMFACLTVVTIALVLPHQFRQRDHVAEARVRSDLRMLQAALQSYRSEQGMYPMNLGGITTPVPYLGRVYRDGYSPEEDVRLQYRRIGRRVSSSPRGIIDGVCVWSVGPDGVDDSARLLYDPTNGQTSPGDIVEVRYSDGPDIPRFRVYTRED